MPQPPSKRIQPLGSPPKPQIPEQPVVSPEEVEVLRKRGKRENKKLRIVNA